VIRGERGEMDGSCSQRARRGPAGGNRGSAGSCIASGYAGTSSLVIREEGASFQFSRKRPAGSEESGFVGFVGFVVPQAKGSRRRCPGAGGGAGVWSPWGAMAGDSRRSLAVHGLRRFGDRRSLRTLEQGRCLRRLGAGRRWPLLFEATGMSPLINSNRPACSRPGWREVSGRAPGLPWMDSARGFRGRVFSGDRGPCGLPDWRR
jgi:hypothetical protein